MSVYEIENTISNLEYQLSIAKNEVLHDDNPGAKANATELYSLNIERLSREIYNWQVVLHNYRTQNTQANAMFSAESIQFNNMVKSYSNWAANVGDISILNPNNIGPSIFQAQTIPWAAILSGSAFEMLAGVDLYMAAAATSGKGLSLSLTTLYKQLNSGFLAAFADVRNNCNSVLPNLANGMVNSVCSDFDATEWANFHDFINSGAACQMPDTVNPDASTFQGFVDGVEAIGAVDDKVALLTDEVLSILGSNSIIKNALNNIENGLFTDASNTFGQHPAQQPTVAVSPAAGSGAFLDDFSDNPQFDYQDSKMLQDDAAVADDFLSQFSSVPTNRRRRRLSPLIQHHFARRLKSEVVSKDFKDKSLNEQILELLKRTRYAKSVARKVKDKKTRRLINEQLERLNKDRRKLSLDDYADPTLSSGTWASVCQSGVFATSNEPNGYLGNYVGSGQSSLFDFLVDANKLITFSANVPVNLRYTSVNSDSVKYYSNIDIIEGATTGTTVDREAYFFATSSGSIGTLSDSGTGIYMGKAQSSQHNAVREIEIHFEDNDFGKQEIN